MMALKQQLINIFGTCITSGGTNQACCQEATKVTSRGRQNLKTMPMTKKTGVRKDCGRDAEEGAEGIKST